MFVFGVSATSALSSTQPYLNGKWKHIKAISFFVWECKETCEPVHLILYNLKYMKLQRAMDTWICFNRQTTAWNQYKRDRICRGPTFKQIREVSIYSVDTTHASCSGFIWRGATQKNFNILFRVQTIRGYFRKYFMKQL